MRAFAALGIIYYGPDSSLAQGFVHRVRFCRAHLTACARALPRSARGYGQNSAKSCRMRTISRLPAEDIYPQAPRQWDYLIFKTDIPRYRNTNLNIFCEYFNILVEVCNVILPCICIGWGKVTGLCRSVVPRLPPWRTTLTSSTAPRTRTTRPRRRRRRATPSTTTRPRTRRVIERIVHGRRASTCAPRTSTYNSHNSRTSTYNSGRRPALNN